jgi:signal transduction histidine kinase
MISKENDEIMTSPEYKDIIESQNQYQLTVGWDAFCQIYITVLTFVLPFSYFLKNRNLFDTMRYVISRLLILIILLYFRHRNTTPQRIEFIYNNFMVITWFMLGLVSTLENIKSEEPESSDVWFLHQFTLFFLTLVYSLKWKRVAFWYLVQKVSFVSIMYWRYGSKLSSMMMIMQLLITLLYPSLCVVICRIVINFLIVVNKNKELANSIKHILQIFPEWVVIRDRNVDSKDIETVFINNEASCQLYEVNDLAVQIVNEKGDDNFPNISLNDLLLHQENKFIRENELERYDTEKVMISYKFNQQNDEKEPRYFTLKTIQVNWENSVHAFLHAFVNTTDVHKLEKAKVTNRWMHIMFSSISHELRTPINAFINANEMIKFGSDKIKDLFRHNQIIEGNNIASLKKMVDLIDKNTKIAAISSNLLLNLTEDILDFAKIEAGIFTLNPSVFTLERLLSDIKFIFGHQCQAKGLDFKIECERELMEEQFCTDPGRIKQVLINLISNAFKFTNNGHIKVAVSSIVQNDFYQNKRFLKFSVEDTGIGISEEDQSKLFKVFGIILKHRQEFNLRGTGLGLTISQKLVKLLGGEISIESEEAKGTTVTFTVQLTAPDGDQTEFSMKAIYEFPQEKKLENMMLLDSKRFFHEDRNPFTNR